MRFCAAILQGYAIVGLVVVCQRPVFGSENVSLKLSFTPNLIENLDFRASQVAISDTLSLDGVSGIPLRMSSWLSMSVQAEDGLKLKLTRSLLEDLYINIRTGGGEPGLKLYLERGMIERSNNNEGLSERQFSAQYESVTGIPLRSSEWLAALEPSEFDVKLQWTRNLDVDSNASMSSSALNERLKLQLARSLEERQYVDAGLSGKGYLKPIAGISLRMSGWKLGRETSDTVGDDVSDLSKDILPGTQRANYEMPSQTSIPDDNINMSKIVGAFGMGLAPIRWGGYVSDNFRATQSSESPTSTDHSQRLDFKGSSYLWQPWLATVSAGVGIARGVSDPGTGDDVVKSNSITGYGELGLFPQSRFPTSVAYSVSDSSTSSSLAASGGMTSKQFSVRQAYRPATGNSNYNVHYQNSTLTNKLAGDDVVDTLEGSYSNRIGNQNFSADASHTETSRSQKSEGLMFDSASANHSYHPYANLSVESNARMSESTLRMRDTFNINPSISKNTARYLQAGSFATWRPKENLPLNVTGGINLYSALSDYGDRANETKSINGSLSTSYQPTHNISLGASGNVTATSTGSGGTNIITTETGSASYNGDIIQLNKFDYNWGVSGSVSNMTSDSMGSSQTLSAGGSHGINRGYIINEYSSFNLGANQTVSSYWSGQNGQNINLNHSGSASWQARPTDSITGSVNLNATDTRTIGSQESENQFVSLQANGHVQLTSYSSATANVGIQLNRQGESSNGRGVYNPASTSLYTNGSASYQNSRAFGVNNLRYSLLASMNMQQTNARLLGDGNASANPMGYSLEQHINYNIGRIDMGLTGTISVQNDRENGLLFFRIGRMFGNY